MTKEEQQRHDILKKHLELKQGDDVSQLMFAYHNAMQEYAEAYHKERVELQRDFEISKKPTFTIYYVW